jgi:cytochrome c oxidase subunit II
MSQRPIQAGGPVAEIIQDLWWLMLGLGAGVFLLFAALLSRGLFRSGRRAGAETSIRAGRWLIGGGVVMPTVVLVVVFAATVYAMRAMPSPAANALTVEVTGHQWWLDVRYPQAGVAVRNELHLPVGRRIALKLSSADVIHSFWVPELGGKMDMLPDRTNTFVTQADEPGRYWARCAEFCGLHHADMKMLVVAEPADQFAAWLAAQR